MGNSCDGRCQLIAGARYGGTAGRRELEPVSGGIARRLAPGPGVATWARGGRRPRSGRCWPRSGRCRPDRYQRVTSHFAAIRQGMADVHGPRQPDAHTIGTACGRGPLGRDPADASPHRHHSRPRSPVSRPRTLWPVPLPTCGRPPGRDPAGAASRRPLARRSRQAVPGSR